MKTLSTSILAVLATVLLNCGAQAAFINGTIAFQGAGNVSTTAGVTTVAFTPAFPAANMSVTGGSGDYLTPTAVLIGTTTSFKNIAYTGTGITAALTGGPIVGLWTFTGVGGVIFSFDLTSLTSGTFVPGNPSSIALSGTGTAHKTGFQDTFGTFALNGTGNGATFTFIQSTTTASGNPVPEGGSALALLGMGFMAAEAIRRKLMAA